jgi:hypothetical protein
LVMSGSFIDEESMHIAKFLLSCLLLESAIMVLNLGKTLGSLILDLVHPWHTQAS